MSDEVNKPEPAPGAPAEDAGRLARQITLENKAVISCGGCANHEAVRLALKKLDRSGKLAGCLIAVFVMGTDDGEQWVLQFYPLGPFFEGEWQAALNHFCVQLATSHGMPVAIEECRELMTAKPCFGRSDQKPEVH